MEHFNPSETMEAELLDLLKRRYPDIYKKESEIKVEAERVHINVSYFKAKSVISASVNFNQGQKYLSAVFEYREKPQPNQREFYWYCTNDWRD